MNDLAREAEARRQRVRGLVAQCAAGEGQRDERMQVVRAMVAEVHGSRPAPVSDGLAQQLNSLRELFVSLDQRCAALEAEVSRLRQAGGVSIEQEATANVLAGLTKLVSSMRAAQTELV